MNQRAAEVAAPGAAHSPELGSLALWLFVACLPVLADPDAVARVAALHPLAAHAGVGLPLETALLVYVWAPMVVLSSFVLVLAPGLLLALLTPVARDGCRWLLAGFAISLFLVSALAGIAQSIAGDPFTGRAFSALIFVSGLATLAVVAGMRTRRPAGPLPPADPAFATTIAGMVAVAWVLMIALAPKIYWENLNGDGAHTLEATRLLLFQPVPFWLPGSGPIASFPGLTTGLFAYPGSWFMRLFGMHEAAVRLPFLLYLFLLFAVIVTLAEHGRRARLTALEQGLLWTGLSIYVVVMSYSATYNPYHADMGLPATQDTLMMVFFLAYALSFLERRHGAMCLYVGLSYFCSPAGLMLIGGWLVAVWLVERPRPWRSMLITVGAVVACKMLAAALPWVLEGLGLPLPGSEHSDFGLARKLRYLQWQDWRRFLFVAVPCGIVPAVALFAWRWQDRGARAFTVLTAGYFSFFYALGYISLHYFVPCMLLPLVVWWRGTALLDPRKRPWLLGATGVAAFAALAISLPRT
ncbi:MAG: hypothetical protein OEM83_07590, partial [Gammaproteobacteria bacterium]|nr:hypothetical protein [Gammaproteobacteria bacterium]